MIGQIFAQEAIKYTTKQGLPSNHVYCIRQDINGFMWFGTNRGIAKYDGLNFKVFTTKDGLPNNDIWHLETDNQGRVWYSSKSKYQGYISNDSVYAFITKDSLVISPFAFYNNGKQVWYGDYELKTGTFSKILQSPLNPDAITQILAKYGFDSNTSVKFNNPERKQRIVLDHKKIGFFNEDYDFLYETKLDEGKNQIDSDFKVVQYGLLPNEMYYVVLNKGVLLINMRSREYRYHQFVELGYSGLVSHASCASSHIEIQISIPGSLIIFDHNFKLRKVYDISKEDNLQNSFKDTDGNTWVAGLSEGLSFIPNVRWNSSYYLLTKKVQKIGAIVDSLFVGVNAEGFYQYYVEQNRFVLKNNLRAIDNVYNIKYDSASEKGYLIAYSDAYVIDKKDKGNKVYPFRNKEVTPRLRHKDIINFKNQNYWISYGGLIREDPERKLKRITISQQGLVTLEKMESSLYAGGSGGLHVLRGAQLQKPNLNSELLDVPIICMKNTDSKLLVGTDGRGVYFFNKEVVHIKSTDGLIVQKAVLRGKELWLATQHGVKVVTIKQGDISNSDISNGFYEADGLLQNNVNDLYLRDSFLFVATDIGLSRININSSLYTIAPKLYFNTQKDTLRLSYKQSKYVSVSFAALDFVKQQHLHFEYRILPIEEKWISTNSRTLNFSNLSPQTYAVEVRVTDQHGNTSSQKQYIKVVPEWWQTIWAKAFFSLLLLLGLILLFSLLKRIIRKKEQQKTEHEKRIAGIELQALRSQMNPHFVHNSLNAIQYYIDRNEVEVYQTYLSKFSRLVRLFFDYSRVNTITLRDEINLLKNYLEIEKLRFEEKLNFTIEVDKLLDIDEQYIPSMLLQPIVENAVNHGLFHKKGKGELRIGFEYLDSSNFEVTIEDNGIGINAAQKLQTHSKENYQSHSSEVLQERLELLKQGGDWNIEYTIADKSDSQKGTGTEVKINVGRKKRK